MNGSKNADDALHQIKIKNRIAYDCYNPLWRDNPDFKGKPQPAPRRIPKPVTPAPQPSNENVDFNTNPNNNDVFPTPNQQRRRRLQLQHRDVQVGGGGDSGIGSSSSISASPFIPSGEEVDPSSGDLRSSSYYADRRYENPGRPKDPETCDDEFLRARWVEPKVPSVNYYDHVGGGH